ncbi:LuxR C-terminal-related transcriptional regulator [Streptomyces sp. NPDC098789]|uniref:LuxR C-terminal-related transcriptional regulator n=1 Tax=Streptomyces sp. NPDC098789 TaxID=3366098 RepID=UPI0037FFE798
MHAPSPAPTPEETPCGHCSNEVLLGRLLALSTALHQEILRAVETAVPDECTATKASRPEPLPGGGRPLTPREQEVLDLAVQGLPNRLIGRSLGISPPPPHTP